MAEQPYEDHPGNGGDAAPAPAGEDGDAIEGTVVPFPGSPRACRVGTAQGGGMSARDVAALIAAQRAGVAKPEEMD
jgi:hypothetical protein